MKINITFTKGAEKSTFYGTMNDSPTAKAIAQALPIDARAAAWGEEIYFGIPVTAALEPGATDLRAVGDLAYWPPGHAFCIFFGRTPASHGPEPRAASPVNLVGKLDLDKDGLTALRAVKPGSHIRVTAAQDS